MSTQTAAAICSIVGTSGGVIVAILHAYAFMRGRVTTTNGKSTNANP